MNRSLYVRALLLVAFLLAGMGLCACTASGDAEEISPVAPNSAAGGKDGKSSAGGKSSGKEVPGSSSSSQGEWDAVDSAIAGIVFYEVVPMTIKKGGASYSVSAFKVSQTEVTQELYEKVMGKLPEQSNEGYDYPVENVNWFQAALFCNEVSKRAGFDTAYIYTSVGSEDVLKGIKIDYSVASMRLPTEMEWEIAAHGGTTSTYYWGTAEASKYAYYGQSKGPARVAQFVPNDYHLYDMAGNVAEWVNDWYSSYPSSSMFNPVGPESGTYRVIRGGSWNSVAKDIAPDVRDKKDPRYNSATVGFRIVYSEGF
ncbi:MAG: SUMF1/EgtB/PvdO family nonheme iron enzyme [Fibrobacter sp.]|nr:SUMF1/EgtB/PvdO family nonheme iron enzyme [Fibrobacter sp.]